MKMITGFVLWLVCFTASAQIKWLNQPAWADVLARARAEHKFIFVDGYTSWCHWCKVMDKSTFVDTVATQFMDRNFISAKMDMERGPGRDLAMKFGVFSFPTYLIFSAEGHYINGMDGFREAKAFVKECSEIISADPQNYPTGISTEITLPFPELYRKRFAKDTAGNMYFADSATAGAWLAKQPDLLQEVPFRVLITSGKPLLAYRSFLISNVQKLRSLYGNTALNNVMLNLMYSRFIEVCNAHDEVALQNEIFPLVDKYEPEVASAVKIDDRIKFYVAAKDYRRVLTYIQMYCDSLKPTWGNSDLVTAHCWNLLDQTDDTDIWRGSAAIMHQLVTVKPSWGYYDTYARMLLKLKDYTAARAAAGTGISLGKKAGDDIFITQKLLDDIDAAAR